MTTPTRTSRARWRRLRENASRARRGVIILPSAFTLGNLFFGIYAIIAAWKGDFDWAAWCIVISAVLDYLDGRVARVTGTGTRFGTELDSLVDAVSFGAAPAFVLVALHLGESDWGWVVGFAYVAAVVLRLARFNVEQKHESRTQHFQGFPTPAAGVILTSQHPFAQTPFAQEHLGALPWTQIMVIATVLVSLLMLSSVPYRKVPQPDLRSRRGIVRTTLLMVSIALVVTVPAHIVFPTMAGYALWGLLHSVLLGTPRRARARRTRRRGVARRGVARRGVARRDVVRTGVDRRDVGQANAAPMDLDGSEVDRDGADRDGIDRDVD